MIEKTEWTLGSILELLTPIFPDVLCGEDDNGQFVIWTGFYKNGKKNDLRFGSVVTITREGGKKEDEFNYNEHAVRAETRINNFPRDFSDVFINKKEH